MIDLSERTRVYSIIDNKSNELICEILFEDIPELQRETFIQRMMEGINCQFENNYKIVKEQ